MTPRAPAIRLVTFGIGDTWYAAEIAYVERVLRHEGVHPVPNMPPWMEGVLEHHGRIVPVIDLRRRFGLVEGDGRAPTSGGGRDLPLGDGPHIHHPVHRRRHDVGT